MIDEAADFIQLCVSYDLHKMVKRADQTSKLQ